MTKLGAINFAMTILFSVSNGKVIANEWKVESYSEKICKTGHCVQCIVICKPKFISHLTCPKMYSFKWQAKAPLPDDETVSWLGQPYQAMSAKMRLSNFYLLRRVKVDRLGKPQWMMGITALKEKGRNLKTVKTLILLQPVLVKSKSENQVIKVTKKPTTNTTCIDHDITKCVSKQ